MSATPIPIAPSRRLDVQVFFASALFQLEAITDDPEDREHVSYGFYRPESGDRWRPRFIRHAACVARRSSWPRSTSRRTTT